MSSCNSHGNGVFFAFTASGFILILLVTVFISTTTCTSCIKHIWNECARIVLSSVQVEQPVNWLIHVAIG